MFTSVLDLHTHTIVSGHAYCTMKEMVRTAADKGVELLGITDHAPAMPGSTHPFYFQNLKVVERQLYGVDLLLGTELNILNPDGQVDLDEKVLRQMDVCIASLHTPCIKSGTVQENTSACINAMKNPYVNIIGHPDDGRYPLDYTALVQAARDYHVLLELNNHSLDPKASRQNARENDSKLLNLCREYQVPVIIDSDAHVDTLINDFAHSFALLEEMDFPQELIVNRSVEAVKPYVNRFKNA